MSQNVNEPVPGQGPIDPTVAGQLGNDVSGIIFRSQARSESGASGGTASGAYVSQDFYNPTAKGVRLYTVINPTGAATGTVTVKIQVIDPATDTYVDLSGATTAAINGTGAPTGVLLTVYPGLTGIANANDAVNQFLSPRWRAVATVALASLTFTVGGDYLL